MSDGALTPSEAVEDYHDALHRKGLKPSRDFADDREITEAVLLHGWQGEMSARRGVLSAGSFCVDFNKSIARWPEQDTVTEVLRIDRQGGGSGYNMAIDLKRLDPAFPVEAMGVVGDDDLGRFLVGECEARGVACDGLKALPGGATMSVDAINVLDSGRRTHFFHAGVAAAMSPDHFDFSSTEARILHLGLPGAHAAMDVPLAAAGERLGRGAGRRRRARAF